MKVFVASLCLSFVNFSYGEKYVPLMEWESAQQFQLNRLKAISARSNSTVGSISWSATQAVAAQTDPSKLVTLRSDRAANVRLLRSLAWLAEAEMAGESASKVIDAAQRMNGDKGNHGFIVKERILQNLEILKQEGLATEENIGRMKRGRSPIAPEGHQFAGQPFEVDHTSPVARRPQYGNEIANLKLVSMAENRAKGARVSPSDLAHEKRLDRLFSGQRGRYVGLGVATGIAFMPIAFDFATGNTSSGQAVYQSARATSLMGVGVGADAALGQYKGGLLRGSVKGNLLMGSCIFAIEAGYLMYEHGGSAAFQEAVFWHDLAGSASGLAVGIPVGLMATTVAAELGPLAPVVGFVAGAGAGGIAYLGGRKISQPLLQQFAPEVARKAETDAIAEVRAHLDTMAETP